MSVLALLSMGLGGLVGELSLVRPSLPLVSDRGTRSLLRLRESGAIEEDAFQILLHELDLAVVIVTHEIQFAKQVSDQVLFTDQGIILEQGPPAEGIGNPREDRTKQFLDRILNPL